VACRTSYYNLESRYIDLKKERDDLYNLLELIKMNSEHDLDNTEALADLAKFQKDSPDEYEDKSAWEHDGWDDYTESVCQQPTLLDLVWQTLTGFLHSNGNLNTRLDELGYTDMNAVYDAQSEARSAHWNAEDELKKLQREDEHDYGPNHVYHALKDQCFKSKVGAFSYEICLFGSASQTNNDGYSVDLGSFSGWKEDYSVMEYTNGDSCWDGPNRSIAVTMMCGIQEAIVSVSEPSKCVYHATMTSISACKSGQIEHDEL
jgi:hypothetical protein